MSPRAECREERKGDDQCLPCVCVVLVTRTGSMGVHPYSKETRVPRQPRGFPGVRVDCCWMIFLPFSGMFLSVLVASWGKEPTGHSVVLNISAVRVPLLRGKGTFTKGVTLSPRVVPSRPESLDRAARFCSSHIM